LSGQHPLLKHLLFIIKASIAVAGEAGYSCSVGMDSVNAGF